MDFKLNIFLFAIAFIGIASSQAPTTCPEGYWGLPDCMNPCGACYRREGEPVCNYTTGECKSCLGGYKGDNCEYGDCENGCGPGECLAPNYCGNCGDINLVSPNCEDIRLRGLLGSLIAFIVVIASITLCGFGSVWYKRRKTIQVSL